MDWFGGSESQSSKEKKGAVMNAVCVMLSDGHVDPREYELLKRILARVNMNEAEMKDMIAHPEKIQFTVPQSQDERQMQLIDIVFMMMADGKIDTREMKIVLQFASMLGFTPQTVADLVKNIITEGIKQGRSRTEVKSDVDAWLGS